MTTNPVLRDERTVSIENASYRWAYLLMSYGLLVATAYRSFVRHESAWDLMALVIAGGVVASVYQGGKQVLSRRWAMTNVIAVVVAGVLAAGIVIFRR
jgi:uncharacterized membrane protein YdcZ (DUF606 family)